MLIDAGSPLDPIEIMLIEQLAMMHLRVAQPSCPRRVGPEHVALRPKRPRRRLRSSTMTLSRSHGE